MTEETPRLIEVDAAEAKACCASELSRCRRTPSARRSPAQAAETRRRWRWSKSRSWLPARFARKRWCSTPSTNCRPTRGSRIARPRDRQESLHLGAGDPGDLRRTHGKAEIGLEGRVKRRLRVRCRLREEVVERRLLGVLAAEDVSSSARCVGERNQLLEVALTEGLLRRWSREAGTAFNEVLGRRLGGGKYRGQCALRRRHVRGGHAICGGERVDEIVLRPQREFVAGLGSELNAKVGVLPRRGLDLEIRELRLRLANGRKQGAREVGGGGQS